MDQRGNVVILEGPETLPTSVARVKASRCRRGQEAIGALGSSQMLDLPGWNAQGGGAFALTAAAKFAVKGFAEALITDLRINAPHIKCSVVMPGHIGTSIPLNTRKVQSGNQADAMDATQLAQARARFASMGRDASAMSDDDIRQRGGRARAPLPRGGADQRRRSGDDHPQRGQGRPMAHSSGARRP